MLKLKAIERYNKWMLFINVLSWEHRHTGLKGADWHKDGLKRPPIPSND